MKSTNKLVIAILFLTAANVFSRMLNDFSGWSQLLADSSDIAIVHCEQSTLALHLSTVDGATKSDCAITVLLPLKGTNICNSTRLWTDHKLQQGEKYLVFGHCDSGIYQAFEEYRVVPLGTDFSTNLITGKLLDEQLQILFKRRLDTLNRQIKEEQDEKQRFEEGIR
jgi:hypothetical protein